MSRFASARTRLPNFNASPDCSARKLPRGGLPGGMSSQSYVIKSRTVALVAAGRGRERVRGRYRVRKRSRTRGPPSGGAAELGAQIARIGVSQAQQSCRASIAAAVARSLAVQPRLRVRPNPPRPPPKWFARRSAEMARETRRHSPQEGGGGAQGCLPPIQCAQRGACHALKPRDT